MKVFPESHRRLLSQCTDYFETNDLIVSHCGINPEDTENRSREEMVMAKHHRL
jgi:hypothetical protein